jgi:hypothetical protein
MGDVVKQLEAKIGTPITVTSVHVSPGSANFSVRDPKQPQHVDTWMYRDGDFTSHPERIEGDRNLDEQSFPLAGLPFAKVREMITAALSKLHIEEGHVTSVSFTRYSEGVRIYIDVEGPRQRGRAQLDARGELVNGEIE